MTKYTEGLDPTKPTVRLWLRETTSGGFKLRLMPIDKPAADGGLFCPGKGDT